MKGKINKVYLFTLNLDYIEDYTQREKLKFKQLLHEKSFHKPVLQFADTQQNRQWNLIHRRKIG